MVLQRLGLPSPNSDKSTNWIFPRGGAGAPTRPPPPAGELDKQDPDHPGTLNRDTRKAAWTQTARTRTVRTHTARTPTVGTQTIAIRKTGTHTATQDTAM